MRLTRLILTRGLAVSLGGTSLVGCGDAAKPAQELNARDTAGGASGIGGAGIGGTRIGGAGIGGAGIGGAGIGGAGIGGAGIGGASIGGMTSTAGMGGTPGGNSAAGPTTNCSADHNVGPNNCVVIPSGDVIGGTDPANNVNAGNATGGFSVIRGSDDPGPGNPQWYKTHVYWDVEGLAYTKVEPPEPTGGPVNWCPMQGEWSSYDINAQADGLYGITYRFGNGWGPDKKAYVHFTIDEVTSGKFEMQPDNASYWTMAHFWPDWWAHTMVNQTLSFKWNLKTGHHTVKFFVDEMPDNQTKHGYILYHYTEVFYAGGIGQ